METVGGGLVAKSCPTLATPWTVACEAPPSIGFSRQEYWQEHQYSCLESSVSKESALSAGDSGLTPWLGRSPGEGNGYPLQYSWKHLDKNSEHETVGSRLMC